MIDVLYQERRIGHSIVFVYVAMLAAGVAAFYLVHLLGSGLAPPVAAVAARPAVGSANGDTMWHVLLALTSVVVLGRGVGGLLRVIGQPTVIGELMAGILLGPSILGRVSPLAAAYVLPSDVAPFLGVLACFGVIIYMFLVGLQLNGSMLRAQIRTSLTTSHASIVVPFVLGSTVALYLYPRFATGHVPFTHFALFLGVAMSITAFPVLARILDDQRMTQSKLGALSLTCAAVGDVTAWCLLALAVGVARGSANSAVFVAVLTVTFIAAMFVAVKPRFEKLARETVGNQPTPRAVTVALIALPISALVTEGIGAHAVFGAFVLGAIIPDDSALARSLHRGMTDLVTIVFMPAFFAFTGMRTQLGLLSGGYEWLVCAGIIAVATIGKSGGTTLAAMVNGVDLRRALALGALMNTRGLMEVIVLNVGLDLGIISPTVFTMLVLMALATTLMTVPLLRLVMPAAARRAEMVDVEREPVVA